MDQLYYLDADGYVLSPSRSQLIFDLPVLTGAQPGNDFAVGKQTKNGTTLDALSVLSVAQHVDEEMYRNISEIHLDGSRDFIFYTADLGIPVILGREQIGTRLVKFDSFWKTVVAREGGEQLQYIDLRFDEQVVVRWNRTVQDVHS